MTAPDPRADLAGRLRQALTAEDAEHAVEIIVGAGWRPTDGLRDWLDSRPVVVRVDGVDYLSVASVRAFADEAQL